MTSRDLKDFRQRMCLTQQECAKALGCSPRSITAWESGSTAIPESVALAASAYAFGLPAMGTVETR